MEDAVGNGFAVAVVLGAFELIKWVIAKYARPKEDEGSPAPAVDQSLARELIGTQREIVETQREIASVQRQLSDMLARVDRNVDKLDDTLDEMRIEQARAAR